jgi:hypothetical protein
VDEPPVEQSLTDEETRDTAGRFGTIGCAGSIVAALIVLLFITYVVTWFQKPSLGIVGSIERWVYFIGNIVVACYCFPPTEPASSQHLSILRSQRWASHMALCSRCSLERVYRLVLLAVSLFFITGCSTSSRLLA